ncbi:hypothetical protein [Algoriphagus sp. PAP.12]|uniref:hypothetical protein n=1 Tax=Algoriphagus sp. PAP.12 TaxID=2996678 RepID=UPI00227A2287|nr:hypothetical protein [Algoriphagus sp. PAP.12]
MKKTLYIIPRNFPYFEKSKFPTPFYIVDGITGEVLHFFNQKNDVFNDLEKSIKHNKRISWILNSREIEIKIIKENYQDWIQIKEKIFSWHERKKERQELLVIVERDPIYLNNQEKRLVFDLIVARTGEKISSRMCSEIIYALNDLKSDLMDIRNDKWDILGNRYEIKNLSETNISKLEIDRRCRIWENNQLRKFFNSNNK